MNEQAKQIDVKVKGYLQSKTIWGIIIALLPTFSKMLGFDIETELSSIYEPAIELIGSVLAVYGRLKASSDDRKIKGVYKKKSK